MSQNNSIKILLNIKDNNIEFEEKIVTDEIINEVICKVFHAKLTYKTNLCPCCGINGYVNKHGFKMVNIKINKVSNYNTYLQLKKQRFYCKSCRHTFIAKTNLVDKNCSISKPLKLAIALECKEKISEKDIARRFNVSHVTVNRIIESHFSNYSANKCFLPEVLCFDEFKSVKRCSGAMSFIMCDGITHKIIDIVEDRRLNKLIDYFSSYTQEARIRVKHIVIDMYAPYISLIKKLFPKAKISIDRFHLVQLINRSFNKTRISIMNKYKTKNPRLYNKLKKYWKLLLMNSRKLSYRNNYHHSFKRFISQNEIVDYLINADSDIAAAYHIYQDFLFSIDKKDICYFKRSIETYINDTYNYLTTSIKTFKKYLPYIENSLKYSYNNGPIEGINNKIKVIKRISFGYRSYLNLRKRIFISCNMLTIKRTLSA